jgi:hypothetical protein
LASVYHRNRWPLRMKMIEIPLDFGFKLWYEAAYGMRQLQEILRGFLAGFLRGIDAIRAGIFLLESGILRGCESAP